MIPRWKILTFWTLLLLNVTLVISRLADIPAFQRQAGQDHPKLSDQETMRFIKVSIYDELVRNGISLNWMSGDSLNRIVRVPSDLPMVEAYMSLANRFRREGAQLVRAEANPEGTEMVIGVGYAGEMLFLVTLRHDPHLKRASGRMILVMVDLGLEMYKEIADIFLLTNVVTLAVVPGGEFSTEISALGLEAGMDILAQWPMPGRDGERGPDLTFSHTLTKQEITHRLAKLRSLLPQATGLLADATSLSESSPAFRSELLRQAEATGFQYLLVDDRGLTGNGVGFAGSPGTPVHFGDLRLDRIPEAPYIRKQLVALAELAMRQGQAIGVISASPMVIRLLKQELPDLRKRGLQFVTLAALIS